MLVVFVSVSEATDLVRDQSGRSDYCLITDIHADLGSNNPLLYLDSVLFVDLCSSKSILSYLTQILQSRLIMQTLHLSTPVAAAAAAQSHPDWL